MLRQSGYELWQVTESGDRVAVEFFGAFPTPGDAWDAAVDLDLDLVSVKVTDRRGVEYPPVTGTVVAAALAAL